jgi:hypothetical protein
MNAGRILATVALLVGATSMASAQATATQDVTIAVNAINQIAVTGGAQSLTISTATAGGAPTDASVAVSWAITTNQVDQKITAQINSAMPAGVTLSANLDAPGTATSAGAQALTTTAVDVVNNLDTVAASGLALTYTLSATTAAGVVASTTRTVTYTITAGP